MKVLVTGSTGQLGFDVLRELALRKITCRGVSSADFDITDFASTEQVIAAYRPDVIIHCAAYTMVDKAEVEREQCAKVNIVGTRNIALACKACGAKMVYISTDYVFAGTGDTYYEADAVPQAINWYGETKLAGEKAVQELLERYFIVRISWVFGKNGNNFVKTMLRLGKERAVLNVVDDQVGSPTYTVDLAKLLCDMIMTDKYGVYQATNEGVCSWAKFAEEIFCQARLPVKVNHIKTADYPTAAKRPCNSRLSKSAIVAAGFSQLPHWHDAIERYLHEIEE